MLVQVRVLQDAILSLREKEIIASYKPSSFVEVFIPLEADTPDIARRLLSPAIKIGEIPLASLKEQARRHSVYAAFTKEEFVTVSGFAIAIARVRSQSQIENPSLLHYISSRTKASKNKEMTSPHYYRPTFSLYDCLDHWERQVPNHKYPSLPHILHKQTEKIQRYLDMRQA